MNQQSYPSLSKYPRRERIAFAVLLSALCLLAIDDWFQRALVVRAEYASHVAMRNSYAAQNRAAALQDQIDQMKAERAKTPVRTKL